MSAALISTLDIAIRGRTGDLDASLDRSGAGLSKFRDRVNTNLRQVDQSFANIKGGQAVQGRLAGMAASSQRAMSSMGGLGSASSALTMGLGGVAIASLAVVAGIGAAVAGIVHLSNEGANSIQTMGRMAQTLGMTTTAFSGLASTSGMEIEKFGKGIAALQRQLSQAALGGGEVATALTQIGLSAQDLMSQNPEQQLRTIANALQNVGNQSDRIRIAGKLFGEEAGLDMVRVLGQGAAGLDALQAKAERFGLVFSAGQAETVERSNRAWEQWSLGLQGVGRQLAIAFAPIWEWAGNHLANFFATLVDWTRSVIPAIETIFNALKPILDDLIGGIGSYISNFYGSTNSVFSFLKNTVVQLMPFIQQYWNIVKAYYSAIWEFIKAGWNALVSLVSPIIEGFVNTIKGWFGGLSEFLIGNAGASWEDWKNAILRVMITLEFAIKNWQRVAIFVWDAVKLKMFEWLQALSPVLAGVQSFLNLVIDGFNSMARAIADLFGTTLNGVIRAYNRIAERTGARRIDFEVRVDARQIDRVQFALADMTAEIEELRARVAEQGGALAGDLLAFINERMAQLTRVNEAVKEQQQQLTRGTQRSGAGSTPMQGALQGSKEAFEIIAQDQGDKQFQVLNNILTLLRASREIDRAALRELQARVSVGIARL